MEIVFPKLSTIAHANEIISKCAEVQESKAGSLTFSLEDTVGIDPFAITVLAGTIQCCLQKNKREIKYIQPKDKRLDNYLSQIGFNRFFYLEGKDIHKNTIVGLAQLTALKPQHIENLILFLGTKLRLSTWARDSLKMSLNEILTNVFDHSKSRVGCFVCAQYYKTKGKIKLCISDFGVGILSNLKDKYKIKTGVDAIKLAVKEGITSRPQSAGFGLSHIRRFLKVNEGTLTIISGKGKVNFYKSRVASYNISKGFKGTIVNLKINAIKESLYFLRGEEEHLF